MYIEGANSGEQSKEKSTSWKDVRTFKSVKGSYKLHGHF